MAITRLTLGAKTDGNRRQATGHFGEDYETDVYQIAGFAHNPKGSAESLRLPINDHADRPQAMPPKGDYDGELDDGDTVIYSANAAIILRDSGAIEIKVGEYFLNLGQGGKIETNMDIETSGDVVAGGVSLKNHIHAHGTPNTSGPL